MLQLNSDDRYRTRVISVYMLVNAGTTPIGNLITGGLSDIYGIKACFIIIGASVFIMLTILYFVNGRKKAAIE